MAFREKLTEGAQPFLETGERVQAVIAGQKLSPWWIVTIVYAVFFNEYRAIVATDRRILLLRATFYSTTKFQGVVAEVPRATRIGPASGLWWKCESVGDRIYVHKRFHKDVDEADTLVARGAGAAPPPAAR